MKKYISFLIFYVLTFTTSHLNSQAICSETKITASDGSGEDRFSDCIAVSGDRVVVGSVLDDDNGTSSGSVYVYDWTGSSWTETKITASDAAAGDLFGASIDIDGDRIVVGSYQDDDNGEGSGSVYVYNWDGTNWLETKITASDGDVEDTFGIGVGVSGDRIVVGAYQDDDNGEDSGSAYIYDWNGSTWVEAKITASDGAVYDWYGDDVSVSGDRVLVGCTEQGDADNGLAYLYDWDGANWIETKITASDGDPFDLFGYRVSIDGDRMVVGAFFDEANGIFSGSAYIYDWNGSAWVETKILASDGDSGDDFSRDVAVSGDRVVVGAHFDDDNGENSGSVYIYEWDGSNWVETKITASDGAAFDRFGRQVDVSLDRIVVGANMDDDNGSNSGSAYIFDISYTYYLDLDGDGYGDAASTVSACTVPPGYVADNTDCDDGDANNYPGNTEVCDRSDNNCDGMIDEGFSVTTYYEDLDGDGYGNAATILEACTDPLGYVTDNTDCDDGDADNYPGNTEVCDGSDNNCDGVTDEGLTITYYEDLDGDGYGDAASTLEACAVPPGYVLDNTDCDDGDADNYPGNSEICDGSDNNCDGVADEGCVLEPCDGDYIIINALTMNTYRAQINIMSDAIVSNGQSVMFTAGTDIDLLPGFEVIIGTEFEARIESCAPVPSSTSVSSYLDIDLERIDSPIFYVLDKSGKIVHEFVVESDITQSLVSSASVLDRGIYQMLINHNDEKIVYDILVIK